jgi:hypothetical protein
MPHVDKRKSENERTAAKATIAKKMRGEGGEKKDGRARRDWHMAYKDKVMMVVSYVGHKVYVTILPGYLNLVVDTVK